MSLAMVMAGMVSILSARAGFLHSMVEDANTMIMRHVVHLKMDNVVHHGIVI
jgi:hypothetical protein